MVGGGRDTGRGSGPREMAWHWALLVREEKSHRFYVRIKLDNVYDGALWIIMNCINVRDCHILQEVLLF